MRALKVHRIAPGATVQDGGRAGYMAFGVSRGGAADRLALVDGAGRFGHQGRRFVNGNYIGGFTPFRILDS
mgnify:CR=1 FL=1